MTEEELVENVIKKFNSEIIFREVKIFTRSIDIVLIKGNDLISIEFKLTNYKKALEQISDYKLVTDYSYICIPKRNLSNTIFNKIKEKKIGLYMFDYKSNNLEEILQPKLNTECISYYKKYLKNKLLNKG